MARPRSTSAKRKPALKPVTFVPVEQVFQPQIQVRATRDLNGWADKQRRVKWHISAGSIGCLDADKAREFQIKGYVEIVDGTVAPASEDEIAEVMSTVTTISLGVN